MKLGDYCAKKVGQSSLKLAFRGWTFMTLQKLHVHGFKRDEWNAINMGESMVLVYIKRFAFALNFVSSLGKEVEREGVKMYHKHKTQMRLWSNRNGKTTQTSTEDL